MSLFANPSYASPGNALWAKKTQSGNVSEPAFIATGVGQPGGNGTFTATSESGGASNAPAFVINDLSGVVRWVIGVSNAEAGSNVGSDLTINAYDDNGVYLDTPFGINRASGTVVASNMNVQNTLTAVDISGANISASSTLTVGGNPVMTAVLDYSYDNSYNYVVAPGVFASGNYETPLGFTPTKSGMYLIEGIVGNVGAAITAALGDTVELILTPVAPFAPGALPASCGKIIMAPTGTDFTSFQSMSADKLVAGQAYTVFANIINHSGTFQSTSATLGFEVYITALC